MNLEEFKKEIQRLISVYPNHKEEILDFYDLALSEIEEEGTSVQNEIYLCLQSIEDLVSS
jgi:hypothetical protein